MVRAMSNIFVPSISHSVAQGGRMSFAVDRSSLIYSNFRYVSGVPAPEGTQGVAISKLSLLDALIAQIKQIKRGTQEPAPGTTPEQLDALIEDYKNQIRQVQAASEAMPYIQSPSLQPGAVVSLTV